MSTQPDDAMVRPLDHVWWKPRPTLRYPPDELPVLAPYDRTRPGFELVNAAACEPGLDERAFVRTDDGHFQVCLWNIWESKSDPADTDPEKLRINAMQCALGVVNDDDRYVRLQIACFERCWYGFPGSIDLILDGVSKGQVNLDARISCEPPWAWSLRPLLRHRRGLGPDPEDGRRSLVRTYHTVLSWWLGEGRVEDAQAAVPGNEALAEAIYLRLGAPSLLKSLHVARLRVALSTDAMASGADDGRWSRLRELRRQYTALIAQESGNAADPLAQFIERNSEASICHHSYFRHLDYQIAAIGAGRAVPLPGAGQERARILGAVVSYTHVLGSWLAHRTMPEAVPIWPGSAETAQRLYAHLGTPTPRKRWLTACLWKRMQEVQAHSGRGALDEQPERFRLPIAALTA